MCSGCYVTGAPIKTPMHYNPHLRYPKWDLDIITKKKVNKKGSPLAALANIGAKRPKVIWLGLPGSAQHAETPDPLNPLPCGQ